MENEEQPPIEETPQQPEQTEEVPADNEEQAAPASNEAEDAEQPSQLEKQASKLSEAAPPESAEEAPPPAEAEANAAEETPPPELNAQESTKEIVENANQEPEVNDDTRPATVEDNAPLNEEQQQPPAPISSQNTENELGKTDTSEQPAEESAEPAAGDSPVDAAPAAGPNTTGFTVSTPDYSFLTKSSTYSKPQAWLPEDAELQLAKSFLKTQTKPGQNVYNHLTSIVMRVLETRSHNATEMFENLSSDIKRSKFKVEQKDSPASFKKAQLSGEELSIAKNRVRLLERIDFDEAEGEGSEVPDVMELSKLWEWAGFSFGQEETYLLFLSLKKLAADKYLKSVRLWGKILGLNSNYIVVEGELKDGAVDEDDLIANGGGEEEIPTEVKPTEEAAEGEEQTEEEIPLPKPKNKTLNPLPKEARSGVNKYVYYVTKKAGGEFIRLPDAIPEKLQTSRKIRKYFTGDLEKRINSYPEFNGTEAQLLRCQIARISAATVVSPAGYYAFDPEEEGSEDAERNPTIIMNTEYEGITNENLLSASNWVHHVPYVLPQGRVVWENPSAGSKSHGDEENEDEDGENEDGGNEEEDEGAEGPETGPTVLTPITADEDSGELQSWSARSCATFLPSKFSPVTLRCNRWPGAFVVAYNDKFANVYVGDGQKCLPNNTQYFVVPKLSEIQHEFASGIEGAPGSSEEVAEQVDPTVDEEKAFEDSQKQAVEEEKESDGEEDAEEKEEEEGGEDED